MAFRIRQTLAGAICSVALAACSIAATAQTEVPQSQVTDRQQLPANPEPAPPDGTAAGAAAGRFAQSTPESREARKAESAYLAGAKMLEHDDLDAAEREFERAQTLDPENRNYAIAISVARQHRLTELVQQAIKARQAGDAAKADTLLAAARAIDPDNPIVLEHSEPFLAGSSATQQSTAGRPPSTAAGTSAGGPAAALADRNQMFKVAADSEPWKIGAPNLAGPIQLAPSQSIKSFSLRGTAADVIREVASEYGIRAIIDDSVETKNLRFDLENVGYQRAMDALMKMANVFTVPVDETSMLVAKNNASNRQRLERQIQETIFVPGATTDQVNDLANVIRNIFDVKQASVQTTLGNIVVRAPQDVIEPMNRILNDLIDSTGELMVEVKMYEVDTTRMTSAGTTIPTSAGIYNVDQAATQLVNANQTLVQQAVAQGLISATASNIQIAAALLASGLVQSTLLSTTIGAFGGGTTLTGITETGTVGVNVGLNTSDTRSLDHVQLRVGDGKAATFREGERYPIITSTYSTGISTAGSAAGNATINGVSVSSLLQQYTGGTSTTIPQVTYEDLGVTLKATPAIQKSGRINLLLDLKIEALSGSSSDGNPVLENRQFSSDLTVADGESVLMVSYVSKTETAAMTGLPGLSELPGFQMPINDNVEKDTSQLVVVVTPHVVRMRSDLLAGPRIPIRNAPVAN